MTNFEKWKETATVESLIKLAKDTLNSNRFNCLNCPACIFCHSHDATYYGHLDSCAVTFRKWANANTD